MTTIAELHMDVGKLQGQVQALTSEVGRLRAEVQVLTSVLHQLRGARYVIILGYSVIAAVAGLLAYFGVKIGTQ
jgi:polysaccharide pyruvyl transferase WcaK-like protein